MELPNEIPDTMLNGPGNLSIKQYPQRTILLSQTFGNYSALWVSIVDVISHLLKGITWCATCGSTQGRNRLSVHIVDAGFPGVSCCAHMKNNRYGQYLNVQKQQVILEHIRVET